MISTDLNDSTLNYCVSIKVAFTKTKTGVSHVFSHVFHTCFYTKTCVSFHKRIAAATGGALEFVDQAANLNHGSW